MGHTQPKDSGAVIQGWNSQYEGDQTIKLQLHCYNYWIPNSPIMIEVVTLTFDISPGIQLVASSVYGHREIAAILWDASISITIAGCTVWQGQGHCPSGKRKFIWHCCTENYSCQEAFKKSQSYVWPLKHKQNKAVTVIKYPFLKQAVLVRWISTWDAELCLLYLGICQ